MAKKKHFSVIPVFMTLEELLDYVQRVKARPQVNDFFDFDEFKERVNRAARLFDEIGKRRNARKRGYLLETYKAFLLSAGVVWEYREDWALGVRQVHYIQTGKGVWPNIESAYDKVSLVLGILRWAELIPWRSIRDPERGFTVSYTGASSLSEEIDDIIKKFFRVNEVIFYKRCLMQDQSTILVVLLEKDALAEQVARVCREMCVKLFVSRGYNSHTGNYILLEEVEPYLKAGTKVTMNCKSLDLI